MATVAIALNTNYGLDIPYAFNRKEAKDHGEGGSLVGAPLQGQRVLILDDVITAGTAIREAMDIMAGAQAIPVGVVISLDRQEVTGREGYEGMSAIQSVEKQFGALPVDLLCTCTICFFHGMFLSSIRAVSLTANAADIPVVSIVKLQNVITFLGGVAGEEATLEAVRKYRDTYGVAY